MKLGIHFMNFTQPGGAGAIAGTLADTARAAEGGGCTTFTLMDHWLQMEEFAPATDPMLEGYTSLGYLAGLTSTMTLSLLVTGVTYRHPALLAKTVTTLDVLSGGRAQLGIGAAWYEREHRAYGVPYPPVAERFERLEETLQICRQMWSADQSPFDGEYYRLAETICSPAPIQQPGPPILIGGGGERKTLRLVAEYADACNLFANGLAEVAHKLNVLAEHCAARGRDPGSIRKTVLGLLDPLSDPDRFIADMADYAELGVELVELVPPQDDPAGWVERVSAAVVDGLGVLRSPST